MKIKSNEANFLLVLLIIVTMTFAMRASNNMAMTTVPLLAGISLDIITRK